MTLTAVMAGAALLWHGAFWAFNRGAYTDGILQIDAFRQGLTYWPPLYGLLARLFAWVPGLTLEDSGRLVSLLSGSLLMFALASIARQLFGLRAAVWSLTAWLACPMAMRWSLQVMTDMPMVALWTASLAALTHAVAAWRPGWFPHEGATSTDAVPDAHAGRQWLWLASLAGVLATLTRYQGILLFVPLAWAVWRLPARSTASHPDVNHSNQKVWLTLLPWLAIPAWLLRQGGGTLFNHFRQMGERTSPGGLGATLVQVYGFLFEQFVLMSPYFFGYGVFLFMLYGLFRTQWATPRLRAAGWVTLYLTLTILAMQSVFVSFQERYLLPLLPLACLFAGHGLATWQRHAGQSRLRLWALAGPALLWGLVFSGSVAVFQGNPFLDVKQAAGYLRKQVPDLEHRRVFSNEIFNTQIGAAKLSYWLGGLPVGTAGWREYLPGDFIVLVSAYGGTASYLQQREEYIRLTGARIVKRFQRRTLPLFPDVMQEPATHQNPLAWLLRYQWQRYETTILEVTRASTTVPGAVQPAPSPLTAPAPNQTPDPRAQLQQIREEIQQIQREIRNPEPAS